jgi:YD repeat-containing protein
VPCKKTLSPGSALVLQEIRLPDIGWLVDDPIGRLTELKLPSPGGGAGSPVIQYLHNRLDYLTVQIDPLDRVTEYGYDSRGRQTIERRVNGLTVLSSSTMEYDDLGFVSKITDPLGRSTGFTYDDMGRLAETKLPGVKDFTSDGNETQTIDFDGGTEGTFKLNGNSKSSAVDLSKLGSLQAALDGLWGPGNTVVTYTATEATVKFRGDHRGANVVQMTVSDISGTKGATPYVATDVNGIAADTLNPTTITEYDALGRAISETDALGKITVYEWSDYGNKLKITLPDPDGGESLSAPIMYREFDKANNRKIETDANGGETVYQYNSLGQLTSVTQPDPDDGDPLAAPVSFYQYDLAGNLRFETNPLGFTTEYEYDHRHRQVKVTMADPDGAGPLPELVTENEYDDANQLVKVTAPGGRETKYVYDGLGRVTSITAPDPDGGSELTAPVTKYAYDAAGQLISSTDPLNNTTTYGYDELGNQVLVLYPGRTIDKYGG